MRGGGTVGEFRPDLSVLAADCVHFSARGLALLHLHLWNRLVQPSREPRWKPVVRPLFCPRPHCPFLLTEQNQRYCVRAGRGARPDPPRLLPGLFAGLVLLAFLNLLVFALCR